MVDFVGSIISVDCGPKGYYQGKLAAIDTESRDLTINSAFRDGVPLGVDIKLHGKDIVGLKVLRKPEELEPNPKRTNTHLTNSANFNRNPSGFRKQTQSTSTFNSNVRKSKAPPTLQRSKSTSSATDKWVARPLPKNFQITHNISASPSSTSSDSEGTTSPEANINKKQRRKKSRSQQRKNTSLSSSSEVAPVESTPTPLFRRYEPQIPKPQTLTAPDWAIMSSKKGRGPCGIPILDVRNGYGRISEHNTELNRPIDFGLLEEDFDFDANLALFDRDACESDDENFYEAVEKPKMSQNFKHNENIVDDPSRITSWTTTTGRYTTATADETLTSEFTTECSPASSTKSKILNSNPCSFAFCPSDMVVSGALRVPVLDKIIKKKFIEESVQYLGDRVFSSCISDRLISYTLHIASRFDVNLEKLYILSNPGCQFSFVPKVSKLISQGFKNRGIETALVSSSDDADLSAMKSSLTESHMVLLMSNGLNDAMKACFNSNRNVHIVAFESLPDIVDLSKVHGLMVASLTSDVYKASISQPVIGKTTFEALCGFVKTQTTIDCCVVDIGVPFSWITDGGAEALAKLFRRSMAVNVFSV